MRRDSIVSRYFSLSKFTLFTTLLTFTLSAHAEYYMVYPAAMVAPCMECAPCGRPVVYMDLTPKYHKVKYRKKPCGTYVVRHKAPACGTYVVPHKTTPCGTKRVSRARVYYPDVGFRVMYVQPIRSYAMEYRDMDRRTGDDDTADLQISN